MPIHPWLITDRGHYFAPASNSRVNRERERESGVSQSLRFLQMHSEIRLSVSLERNEMVCPLFQFSVEALSAYFVFSEFVKRHSFLN